MININIPSGVDHVTIPGLTQWDKGQKLAIQYDGMPSLFEVHFATKASAYSGTTAEEALIVFPTVEDGVAVVDVPNKLLQQTQNLVAYVYEIDGDSVGETTKTIDLPLVTRPMPADFTPEVDEDSVQDQIENALAGAVVENSRAINVNAEAISANTEKLNTHDATLRTHEMKLAAHGEVLDLHATRLEELGGFLSLHPLWGKRILCLGDSIMGNDQVDGVPSYLAEYSGATVFNGGLGGSCMAVRTNGTANNCFDLPNLLAAATSGNWTTQETQAPITAKANVFKYFPGTINMLKELDMRSLDVITLAYGTNDWATAQHTWASFKAALDGAIDTIRTNWPTVRILVITPIWRYFGNLDGSHTDGDTETGYGEGFTLKEWSKKIEEAARDKRVSVLNAYENLPLCFENVRTFFDTNSSVSDGMDHTHLNAKGNQMYAHIINGALSRIF